MGNAYLQAKLCKNLLHNLKSELVSFLVDIHDQVVLRAENNVEANRRQILYRRLVVCVSFIAANVYL